MRVEQPLARLLPRPVGGTCRTQPTVVSVLPGVLSNRRAEQAHGPTRTVRKRCVKSKEEPLVGGYCENMIVLHVSNAKPQNTRVGAGGATNRNSFGTANTASNKRLRGQLRCRPAVRVLATAHTLFTDLNAVTSAARLQNRLYRFAAWTMVAGAVQKELCTQRLTDD